MELKIELYNKTIEAKLLTRDPSGTWRIDRLCGIIDGGFKRRVQFRATMKSILSARVDDSRVGPWQQHGRRSEVTTDRAQPTEQSRQWLFVLLPQYVSISCPQCLTDAWPFYTSSFPSLPNSRAPSPILWCPPVFLLAVAFYSVLPAVFLQDQTPTFFTNFFPAALLISNRLFVCVQVSV